MKVTATVELRNVHDQGRFEQTIMFLHLQESGERRKWTRETRETRRKEAKCLKNVANVSLCNKNYSKTLMKTDNIEIKRGAIYVLHHARQIIIRRNRKGKRKRLHLPDWRFHGPSLFRYKARTCPLPLTPATCEVCCFLLSSCEKSTFHTNPTICHTVGEKGGRNATAVSTRKKQCD